MPQWQKGQSGNPNGRPAGTKNVDVKIRELYAQLFDEPIIKTDKNGVRHEIVVESDCRPLAGIIAIANDKTVQPATRLKALETLTAYLYGKPKEEVAMQIEGEMHHELGNSLEERLAAFHKIVGKDKKE